MFVRRLELGDIEATAVVLAKAMDDDPAYRFLFPRDADRPTGLADFFARNLRTHLAYRCTYVGVANGAVVATVTLRPPEGFVISLPTMLRRGLLPFAWSHGHRAVKRLLLLKSTYDAIEARLADAGPNWLVRMMAVEPAVQGQGLGTQLLREVLSSRDAEHSTERSPLTVLTTHTQRNVVFYERAGFAVDRVEEVTFMGAERYSVWSMRRGPLHRSD